ncbi:hypothetical protein [Streptomyces sp. NPDC059003]|uniref:hypothetical protein n=1 Tax=Streptomyces sp. NPDC059003 TaxID=3346691 RepID=UPI00369560B7
MLVMPPGLPEARAVDICDLPGCGALEKGAELGADFGKGFAKGFTDPFRNAQKLGKKAKSAYDLASDPMGYFSEKFAKANGKLIQELAGEVKK